MEDTSGIASLKVIQSKELNGSFKQHAGSTLSIGQSRSTWWIRIKLDNFSGGDSQKYLSIYNPTVEKAVLYMPVITNEGTGYKMLSSGWGFHGDTQDEDFTYPIFKLADNMAFNKFVYLQLSSSYTQNYSFKILQDRELNSIKLKSMLVLGIFFGLLLAMGINNLLNFLSLKDSVHLYYVIYIFSMLGYQGALLGVYRIFMGRFAEVLIENVIILGLFMLAAAIMFFMSFFNTVRNFSLQDKYSKALVILCMMGIVLMLSDLRYEASIFSTLIAAVAGLLILYTTILAVGKGIKQAKYFLAGWCTMLLSVIIFSARVWGLIPNNDLTLFTLLLSAVVEAILLSAALANRVQVLREEKEHALLLFKNAEESSISNESAFLQAQIKPHFLYNSLNIIAALCRMDAGKARELILDLSSYLHHSFDFGNLARYITFDEELESIQAYVRIEQARFKDKLNVEYQLEETEELRLPPLILQPLIENAIRHGIRKSDGGGTVALRVKKQVDCFIIEIEDDGAGMTGEQLEKVMSGSGTAVGGVGLANIQRRLRMLYGTQLVIHSQPGKGTMITLVLPKGKENDL
jgi:sensor histidine kinase YesM